MKILIILPVVTSYCTQHTYTTHLTESNHPIVESLSETLNPYQQLTICFNLYVDSRKKKHKYPLQGSIDYHKITISATDHQLSLAHIWS